MAYNEGMTRPKHMDFIAFLLYTYYILTKCVRKDTVEPETDE